MSKIISIHSFRPGTGKSNITVNIATILAAAGQRIGIIDSHLSSPIIHTLFGLSKEAIRYSLNDFLWGSCPIEETAKDARVYLDGLPVGLIVTAYGWQATGSTLATLRSIVHALRGWPTPLGAAIRSTSGMFQDGQCRDEAAASQLDLVGRQVVEFARLRRAAPSILSTGPVEE